MPLKSPFQERSRFRYFLIFRFQPYWSVHLWANGGKLLQMIKIFGRIFARIKVGSGVSHHAHILLLRVSNLTKLMTRAWVTPTKRKTGIIRLTWWKQPNCSWRVWMPNWTLDFSQCPCQVTHLHLLVPATPYMHLRLPLKAWGILDLDGRPAILLHPCWKHFMNPLSYYQTTNYCTRHISNLETALCLPHIDCLLCRPKVPQQTRIPVQFTASNCTHTLRRVNRSFLRDPATRRFENGISIQELWNG